MTKKIKVDEIVTFPRIRQIIIGSGRLFHRKYKARGLLEFDVTNVLIEGAKCYLRLKFYLY